MSPGLWPDNWSFIIAAPAASRSTAGAGAQIRPYPERTGLCKAQSHLEADGQTACQRGASKPASVQPCVPRRDRSIAGQGGREPSRRDRPPDDGAEPPFDRRHRPANGFRRSLPHAPRLPARLWTAATGDPTKRACGAGGVTLASPRLIAPPGAMRLLRGGLLEQGAS